MKVTGLALVPPPAAADLPKFKDEFKDPEEPSKGRFYGCPAGWGCEVVSTNLFHALKLDDTYTLYSPGTGAAQKAATTTRETAAITATPIPAPARPRGLASAA